MPFCARQDSHMHARTVGGISFHFGIEKKYNTHYIWEDVNLLKDVFKK